MKFRNMKGALNTIPAAVMMLVLIGIFAAVGINIFTTMNAGQAAGSIINTTISNATTGIVNVTTNMGLLGTIIIFGVIIAVLVMYFGGFMGGRRGV